MNTLQASQAKKKPQVQVKNDLETDTSFKSIPQGVMQEVTKASQDAVKDMWDSLLGANKYSADKKQAKPKMGGDLTPGQAVDLKKAQEQKTQAPRNEAPMNYNREIAEVGQYTLQKETQQIRQEVQSIIYELKRLASSTKAIQKDIEIAIGPSATTKPGLYHKNFFEWMLIIVRDARKRVENAGAWLHSVKSKRKGAIGRMKKNMNELMSGERSSSNQTG